MHPAQLIILFCYTIVEPVIAELWLNLAAIFLWPAAAKLYYLNHFLNVLSMNECCVVANAVKPPVTGYYNSLVIILNKGAKRCSFSELFLL